MLFIESWIDDGCPATDETGKARIEVSQPLKMALAQGHEEHPLSTRSVNEYGFEAAKPKVRKNIECLTPDELERFRRVIKVMRCYDDFHQYDKRSFRYWADIHANNCQHGWEQFLTWHRMYLYYFEQQMQDIDPTVALPYWDWPMYRDDVLKSIDDMKSAGPLDNGTVPKAYRCFVDETMLNNLKGKIPDDYWMKLKYVEGQAFDSGNRLYGAAKLTYGDKTWDDMIMGELQRVNPLWVRNRWPGGNKDLIFEALVPEERLAVACMSDVDVVKEYHLSSSTNWFELMHETRHTKARVRQAQPLTAPLVHAAYSQRLERMTGDAWLAVGDAATTLDPLSSLGIFKGLRSGIMASYAIADYFKGSSASLEKYEAILATEFEEYLSTRGDYYRQEQRWQNSSFWRRRYDYITLDPSQVLRSTEAARKTAAFER